MLLAGFQGAIGCQQIWGRSTILETRQAAGILEGVGDPRQKSQMIESVRRNNREKAIDQLAVSSIPVEGLPKEGQTGQRLSQRQDEGALNVGDGDPVAQPSGMRTLTGGHHLYQEFSVGLLRKWQPTNQLAKNFV